MKVQYGVYCKTGDPDQKLIVSHGEQHIPVRTRRKYAGKKLKLKQ